MPYFRHNANCTRNSSFKLIDMITKKEAGYQHLYPSILFFNVRIGKSIVMSASVDGLFKYGETSVGFDRIYC